MVLSNGSRALVLGGGAVGMASAFRLAQAGLQVSLIDRCKSAGLECSYSNAAVLCPAHSRAKHLSVSNLLCYSLRTDDAVSIEWKHLIKDRWFWQFGTQLLRHWPRKQEEIVENGKRLFAIANYGVKELKRQVMEVKELNPYESKQTGLFALHTSQDELDLELKLLGEVLNPVGYRLSALTRDDCFKLEPALENMSAEFRDKLVGAVFKEEEQIADPFPFSQALFKACQRLGVRFIFDTKVKSLMMNSSKNAVSSVLTNHGVVESDVFVVALGAFTPHLISSSGSKLPCPIYPLRGHALTLDIPERAARFSRPISFQAGKIYTNPLPDGKQRVTGFGDLGGYAYGPAGVRRYRLEHILNAVQAIFPAILLNDVGKLLDYPRKTSSGFEEGDPIRAWTGLRPQSADNVPIVGNYSSVPNLFANSGSGVMGWTSSNGQAALLTDLIVGKKPALEPAHYSPDRFI